MIADLIERAGRTNADLLAAIERLQTEQRINDQLVISSAMKALGRCVEADGLSPSARQQVRSAYRMCRAAMGIEDATQDR